MFEHCVCRLSAQVACCLCGWQFSGQCQTKEPLQIIRSSFRDWLKFACNLIPLKLMYILRKRNWNTGTWNDPRRLNTHQQRSRINLIHAHSNKQFCSQRFLGLCRYFRDFISFISTRTKALRNLLNSVDRGNIKTGSRLDASHQWSRCDVVLFGLKHQVSVTCGL